LSTANRGFTLVELSIVLVIIGLIVGGILTGQSLIAAAGVRAQITQIERYNTAANTFFGKYGYLPGDIPAAPAAQFGFASRGQYAGEGDGNGVIEGITANAANSNSGTVANGGETAMFWVDLSAAHLIDGGFSTASSTAYQTAALTGNPSIASFLPVAKIGNGNYVGVWSGGILGNDDTNYFSVSAVTSITCCGSTALLANPAITVAQAYAIDKKTDDGLPQTGNVTAMYVNAGSAWSNMLWGYEYGSYYLPEPAGPTTCYDNNNVTGQGRTYSLSQNNGAGANCGLSFKLQTGN
jgi:prepilin-type N-terminal cleavage/methylation domain-containing protein